MKLFVTALAISAANAQYSLADCNTFASEFESTCGGTAFTGGVGTWASTTVNCSVTGSPAMGQPTRFKEVETGTSVTSGSHDYKFCVTCRNDGGTIKIKAQSNTLPSRCYGSGGDGGNYPIASMIIWESTWNPDVTGQLNYQASSFNSEASTTSTICQINITQESNMNAWSGYTNNAGSINSWAGIALDGVPIFNALAGGNVDAVETEGEGLDMCLTHSNPPGTLHYHSLGACVMPSEQSSQSSHRSTSVVPGLCDNSYNDCLSSVHTFAVAEAWQTTTNHGGVFGLARDGHKIVGPYDANGELWDCSELDMCAGAFSSDGSYVYAPTASFPHVLGCWGPAPASEYRPSSSCTNLACTGINNDSSNGATELATFVIGVFATLTAVMF